jgi:ribose transport system substrate-binding protein
VRGWSRGSLALGLAAATAFVAACGGGGGGGDGGGESVKSSASARACGPDGKYVIGMSQANNAEPYRQRMNDDIRRAAAAVPQFSVKFSDAAQDNAKQVSDVENYLTQQIDLLIISPNEAAPLTAVVKKAYDQKIPVVVLDRKVEGNAYTTFIGSDNTAIGRKAGEYWAKTLLPKGGDVAELKGLPGSTPAQEREAGFRQGIASNPKIKVVATGVGDWLRDKGQQQAEAILQAHGDLDGFYSQNDPMAEGAYLAAKSAGVADKLKITGIDGLPIPSGGIKAVEAGRLDATLVYPTGGKEAVAAAKTLLLRCGSVPKNQTLPTTLVTPKNAAQVYARLNQ